MQHALAVVLVAASLGCGARATELHEERSASAETRDDDATPPATADTSDGEAMSSALEPDVPISDTEASDGTTSDSSTAPETSSPVAPVEAPFSTLVDAVYVARTEIVTTRRALYPSDLCAMDLTRVDAPPGGEPARICSPLRNVMGQWRLGGFQMQDPSVFIATRRVRGREQIVAAVIRSASCDASPCPIPESEMRMGIACAEAEAMWEDVPPADLRCANADDCEVVAVSCGVTAFARSAAPRYLAHAPCPSPRGGACRPQEYIAVCEHHRCGVEER